MSAKSVRERLEWCLSEARSIPGAHALVEQLHEALAEIEVLERQEANRESEVSFEVRYHNAVNEIVGDIEQRVRDGQLTDGTEVMDAADEDVDGHQMVIYTAQARGVLAASRNEDAYWQENGEALNEMDWSRLAYYAMRADVSEEIRRRGLDDVDTWLAENVTEEEEEEEAAEDASFAPPDSATNFGDDEDE